MELSMPDSNESGQPCGKLSFVPKYPEQPKRLSPGNGLELETSPRRPRAKDTSHRFVGTSPTY